MRISDWSSDVCSSDLAVAVAKYAFPNRLGALGLAGLSAIFSNTGYMGIPLLMLAFGEAGMLPAIITTILNGAVIMAFGIVLLELDVHQGKSRLVVLRSEEHTSELQSLMRTSYAVFCLKKKKII